MSNRDNQPVTDYDELKVEVVLLDSSFKESHWTASRFDRAIIKPRSPKEELVVNNRVILRRGLGTIPDGILLL